MGFARSVDVDDALPIPSKDTGIRHGEAGTEIRMSSRSRTVHCLSVD
jgi:hypothetical protein